MSWREAGQWLLGILVTEGPSCHSELGPTSVWIALPLVGKSAMLLSPGQWCSSSTRTLRLRQESMWSRISATRFPNQTSSRIWSHLMAEMVHWESPKRETLLGSLLNPGIMEVIALASSRRPLSSVLGVEIVGEVGVTLALDISSQT